MPERSHREGKRQGNPPSRKRARQKLTQTVKQAEALRLRIAGATYEEIATALGYMTRGGAYRAIMDALRKTIQEPADEVRKIELARLDRLLLSVWAQATTANGNGHFEAMDRVIKIMAERRFYIVGLKVPEKIEHAGEPMQIVVQYEEEQASP
jgi:UTP:GlnB (protein PII) uridylyltransferase